MEKSIYEKMTDKIMLSGSTIIPVLFEMIADKAEAELLMSMPGSIEELAEKNGRSVEETEKMCLTLYTKGLAFKSFKGGKTGYKMCRDMIQFHDGTILWPDAPLEYLDLWQKFIEEEWPAYARLADQFFPKAFTRIIPVEEAVDQSEHKILDMDSSRNIVMSSEILAVTKCTCRVIAHKCDMPVEVCIQVDNAARYTLDRGTGREISKDEAIKILKDCEEKGLVHVTMNKSHAGHFICNCCSCCCQTLPLLISERLNLTAPSRFSAVIDEDSCIGCGTCVERCYFNAIDEKDDGKMAVNTENCLGCGLCSITCPEKSIKLVETRSADFIPD